MFFSKFSIPNKSSKAQVWISVVLYTVIGLTAIGILLAVVTPRLAEKKDEIVIKQTSVALTQVDKALRSTLIAPGNRRVVDFSLRRGTLEINPATRTILWSMNSKYKYSEPWQVIEEGVLLVKTEETSGNYKVKLTLNYKDIADLRTEQSFLTLGQSAVPYKIILESLPPVDSSNPTSLMIVRVRVG